MRGGQSWSVTLRYESVASHVYTWPVPANNRREIWEKQTQTKSHLCLCLFLVKTRKNNPSKMLHIVLSLDLKPPTATINNPESILDSLHPLAMDLLLCLALYCNEHWGGEAGQGSHKSEFHKPYFHHLKSAGPHHTPSPSPAMNMMPWQCDGIQ